MECCRCVAAVKVLLPCVCSVQTWLACMSCEDDARPSDVSLGLSTAGGLIGQILGRPVNMPKYGMHVVKTCQIRAVLHRGY